MPTASTAAVASSIVSRSPPPLSTGTMPHFTTRLLTVAITIDVTATLISCERAHSPMESVIASTSVRPHHRGQDEPMARQMELSCLRLNRRPLAVRQTGAAQLPTRVRLS